MAADKVYRSPDGRLRSRSVVQTTKSESPEMSDAQYEQLRKQLGLSDRIVPRRATSNDDRSGQETIAYDVEHDTEEGGPDSGPDESPYDTDENDSQGGSQVSKRGTAEYNEAISNHADSRRQSFATAPHPRGSSDDLTLPSDNVELKHIINAIDKRHCLKYRWYVARHLRRSHDPALILSRQLYYKRVIKGHDFVKSHTGAKGWTLARLRPNPIGRIDFEATRAHLDIREAFYPSVWSTEKKRIPPERLVLVLQEAPRQYGWEDAVTDATVDTALRQSGVFDLTAFEISRGNAPSASASPSSAPLDEDSHAQEQHYGDGDKDEDEDEDEDHEDGLGKRERTATEEGQEQVRLHHNRPGTLPTLRLQPHPSQRRGSLLRQQLRRGESQSQEPQSPQDRTHHSVSPRNPPQTPSYRDVEGRKRDKKKKSNGKEMKKERKDRKRMHRQRRELESQLEDLHQQFQEDLTDVSAQYHRRRLRVEKKLRSLQSP